MESGEHHFRMAAISHFRHANTLRALVAITVSKSSRVVF